MAELVEQARDQLLAAREQLLAQLGQTAGELKGVEAALRAIGWEVFDRRHPASRRRSGGTAERAIAALSELGKPSTAPQVTEQMVRRGWIVDAGRPAEYVRNALTRAISTGEVLRVSRGKYLIVTDAPRPKDA